MRKEDNKGKILNMAKSLFYTFGYSKITMDDISRKLGMSKKTLYNYFDGKYDILLHILQEFKLNLTKGVEEIISDVTLDYPVKLKKLLTYSALQMSGISGQFLEDLQINAPEIWKEINNIKKESAFMRFNRLIDEGIRKGHINKNVNQYVVIALYASAVQDLLDPAFVHSLPHEISKDLPQNPSEMFDKMVNIIYEGILNEETKIKFRNS